jgi:hypothetical protein
MGEARVVVESVGTLPIKEVSGLALRPRGGVREVLAIGDKEAAVAVGPLVGGKVQDFQTVNLRPALRKAGAEPARASQWEGITADADGRVFIVEEVPGHVLVFDPDLRRLESRIALDVPEVSSDPDLVELAADWALQPNSRGEGIVLLGRGHLLVLKEKEPRRLVEFGPEGDAPVGLVPLAADAPFRQPPPGESRMVPLRVWKFDDPSKVAFPDVADLAADRDGRLWVVSDEQASLGRIDANGLEGRLTIVRVASLGGTPGLEKPEGLVVLETGVMLVACDQRTRGGSLFAVGVGG